MELTVKLPNGKIMEVTADATGRSVSGQVHIDGEYITSYDASRDPVTARADECAQLLIEALGAVSDEDGKIAPEDEAAVRKAHGEMVAAIVEDAKAPVAPAITALCGALNMAGGCDAEMLKAVMERGQTVRQYLEDLDGEGGAGRYMDQLSDEQIERAEPFIEAATEAVSAYRQTKWEMES